MTVLFPSETPEPINKSTSSSASTIDELLDWRVRDKLRTVAAGLVLCLHLGVDPPDVWKPSPCARWECWIDPLTGNAIRKVGHQMLHLKSSNTQTTTNSGNSTEKVRDAIARNLLLQYETWQPRVRYKSLLDPTIEELRKLCISLRKSARHERVLLHYNGHGVPRPTRNGELWVFNKQFTQYIPVNVADIVAWIGTPSVWIFDCPAAAFLSHSLLKVVSSVYTNADSSTSETGTADSSVNNVKEEDPSASASLQSLKSNSLNLIIFSACDSHETLPFTPNLPADILTSCLTTPLDMAIRWHCYIGGPLLPKSLSSDTALQIPGKLSDRRTPLGELNWIFTAITDTIAWLILPRELFRRLYRQDLLIASLSRNYLLAQRILKSLYCTASDYPPLPPAHQHNLWTLWDHALDTLLAQLVSQYQSIPVSAVILKQSSFFPDQLDAFELWLRLHRNLPPVQISGPPDQLPAALQVLLSQNLRPRALRLFAEFCNFGPWACLECLHVGIHPYILKLISSPNTLNNPINESVTRSLLHIWTRLMSVDPSCKLDLLKNSAFLYFLYNFETDPLLASKALVTFGSENAAGKEQLMTNELFHELLNKNHEILSKKTAIDENENCTIWRLFLNSIFNSDNPITDLFDSENPQVRAAALLSFMADGKQTHETLKLCLYDPSPFVRLEVLNIASQDPLQFGQIICSLCDDPFDPISIKAQSIKHDSEPPPLKSYLIAHFVKDSNETTTEIPEHRFNKFKALNQLEIEAWLERPLSARKFDSQMAVIEANIPIHKIVFHPILPHLYLLDSFGILKQWNWSEDPDKSYNNLQEFTVAKSPFDFIVTKSGRWIASTGSSGMVRITETQNDALVTAFDCQDSHVKIKELKDSTGFILAGDTKISIYDISSSKLKKIINRSSSSAVTCFSEISDGTVLIGTREGRIELCNFIEGTCASIQTGLSSSIIRIWTTGIDKIYAVTSNCCTLSLEKEPGGIYSCKCINNFHFGSVPALTSLALHPVVSTLLAWGCSDQSIRIGEIQANSSDLMQLQTLRYHDGFLGQRLGHIGQVIWHPNRMIMAAITSDTFVSIYQKKEKEG